MSEFPIGFLSDCIQTPTSEHRGNVQEEFRGLRLRFRRKDGPQYAFSISCVAQAGRIICFSYVGSAWFRSAPASATIRVSRCGESGLQMVIMSDITYGPDLDDVRSLP